MWAGCCGGSGGPAEGRGAGSWGGVECWVSPLERTLVFLSEIPSPAPDVSPSPDSREGGLVPRGFLLRDGGFRYGSITGHEAKPCGTSAAHGTSPRRSLQGHPLLQHHEGELNTVPAFEVRASRTRPTHAPVCLPPVHGSAESLCLSLLPSVKKRGVPPGFAMISCRGES